MKALRMLSVLCSALVFGLTLSHVLQAPGSRTLDGRSWLQVQHSFYGGFAVVGGVAETAGVIVTSLLVSASRRRGATAWPSAVAAVCLFGTLAAYFWGNRPVNRAVAEWTASTLPPTWQLYRAQWETAHAASAMLSAVALMALLITTIKGSDNDNSERDARHIRPGHS